MYVYFDIFMYYNYSISHRTLSYLFFVFLTHTFSGSMNYTSDDQQQYLADALQGEFCYVQTSDGKIVSVHYGATENEDAVHIKRSIASTFQANFDGHDVDIEEADSGSIHTSHYRYVFIHHCTVCSKHWWYSSTFWKDQLNLSRFACIITSYLRPCMSQVSNDCYIYIRSCKN